MQYQININNSFQNPNLSFLGITYAMNLQISTLFRKHLEWWNNTTKAQIIYEMVILTREFVKF